MGRNSEDKGISYRYVSATVARECFLYESETGTLYERETLSPAATELDEDGNASVYVIGTKLLVRNVVWCLHGKPVPERCFLLPLDGDESNNRIENLTVGESLYEPVQADRLSISMLKDNFSIDAEKGLLFRKVPGCPDLPITTFSTDVGGKSFVVSRIIYMIAHSRLLATRQIISHLNGNKYDNRIENLHERKPFRPGLMKVMIDKSKQLRSSHVL